MSRKWRAAEEAYGILKHMKGGMQARGFTITETLIVLAVTGLLFVSIAVTLSTRQSRTQFTQAVQEVQSQIQQLINDVAVGYYPSRNNFTCTATLTGPSISSVSGTEQGANKGCIFLGKAVQFGVGSNPESFNIFTIAGLQRTTTDDEVSSYAEAMPKAISPPASPDVTEKEQLLYGLTVSEVYYGTPKINVGTVAFLNSVASYNGGAIKSGAQQVQVLPVKASGTGETQEQAAADIDAQLATSDIDPVGGVKVCFVSGGSNQSGLITIGSNGRQLSVTLDIKGNTSCA